MTQNLFVRARLSDSETRTVLKNLKNILSDIRPYRVTYATLCDELKIERNYFTALKNVVNNRSPGKALRVQIHEGLDQLDHSVAVRLATSIKGQSRELYDHIYLPVGSLSNVLSRWTSDYDMQARFNEIHAGDNGRYYNLRLTGDEEIICARMYVSQSTPLHPLPRFFTYRPITNKRKRFVRGVIFSSLEKSYAFGKTRYGNGFRATILESRERSGGQHDLFGVRVGLQESMNNAPDKPFGYPIYCYQIQRDRRYGEVKRAVGVHSISEFEKMNQVTNFEEVLSFLRTAQESTVGVSFPDLSNSSLTR